MICFVIELHSVQETVCIVFIWIACCCYTAQHALDCNCMPDWDTFLQRGVWKFFRESKNSQILMLLLFPPYPLFHRCLRGIKHSSLTDIQIPSSIVTLSPVNLSSPDQRHGMSFILWLQLSRQNPDGSLGGQAFLLLVSFPIPPYTSLCEGVHFRCVFFLFVFKDLTYSPMWILLPTFCWLAAINSWSVS